MRGLCEGDTRLERQQKIERKKAPIEQRFVLDKKVKKFVLRMKDSVAAAHFRKSFKSPRRTQKYCTNNQQGSETARTANLKT